MDCDADGVVDEFGHLDIVVESVRAGRMMDEDYTPVLGWKFVGLVGGLMGVVCILSLLAGCL